MLTFGELINRVATNVQVLPTDAYATITIPRFVQDAYELIWNSQLWDEIIADDFTLNLSTENTPFILDKQYGPVLRAYNNGTGQPIKIIDRSSYADQAYDVGAFLNKDQYLDCMTQLPPSAVLAQPANAQILHFMSSSALDITPVIFIRGIDQNNQRVSESITLNGTTGVPTVNQYQKVEAWSKTLRPTNGYIVLADSLANTLGTLGVWETTAVYRRYQINNVNPQNVQLQMTCKKAFIPFQNNFDYAFTELDLPLIDKATEFAWDEHRQLELAQKSRMKYDETMKVLTDREMNQEDTILFVPAMRG